MSDNPVLEPADKFYTPEAEAEPTKPTEEVETAEIQDPPEEALETPDIVSEESEATDEEEDAQYLDLDGKETSLDDVRAWRDGHLMQKDYTQKTQTLAEERKTFEAERSAEREELLKSKSEAAEMRDQLAVLVAEDEEIDWAELKEDDPEKYIELKEKADKRRETLEKIKAERQTPVDDPAFIASEQKKLFSANPDWLDDEGKPTETYQKDTALMNEFSIKAGFDAEEFKHMRAHHLVTILKAAKYDQLQEKGRKIKETREKVPVVTKPKATKSSEQPVSMADKFYGKTG
jgi:hypothetical protein